MIDYYDVTALIVCSGPTTRLTRCLRSCLAQTLPGRSLEVLVVNSPPESSLDSYMANQKVSIQLISGQDPNWIDATMFTSVLAKTTSQFVVILDGNDYIRNHMFYFQLLYLYDNPNVNGVAVDHWLVEKHSDKKLEKHSFSDTRYLSGIMWRKDYLDSSGSMFLRDGLLSLDEISPKQLESLQIGNLPISFLRRSM